jgi:hypothetical protein
VVRPSPGARRWPICRFRRITTRLGEQTAASASYRCALTGNVHVYRITRWHSSVIDGLLSRVVVYLLNRTFSTALSPTAEPGFLLLTAVTFGGRAGRMVSIDVVQPPKVDTSVANLVRPCRALGLTALRARLLHAADRRMVSPMSAAPKTRLHRRGPPRTGSPGQP